MAGGRARRTIRCRIPRASGTWSAEPFSSWTQSGRVRAFSKSKRPVSKTLVSGTSQKSVSMTRAPGLRLRMMRRASANRSGPAVVTLLRTITSANSIWSTRSSTRVRWSSASRFSPRSRRKSWLAKSRVRLAASTTVSIVSSRATSERLTPAASRKSKVAATGSGSEMPVELDEQVVEAAVGGEATHLGQEVAA